VGCCGCVLQLLAELVRRLAPAPGVGNPLLGLLGPGVGVLGELFGAGGRLLDPATVLGLGVGDTLVGVLLGALVLGRDVLVGLALGLGLELLGRARRRPAADGPLRRPRTAWRR
jgi:hypothetical protein